MKISVHHHILASRNTVRCAKDYAKGSKVYDPPPKKISSIAVSLPQSMHGRASKDMVVDHEMPVWKGVADSERGFFLRSEFSSDNFYFFKFQNALVI